MNRAKKKELKGANEQCLKWHSPTSKGLCKSLFPEKFLQYFPKKLGMYNSNLTTP